MVDGSSGDVDPIVFPIAHIGGAAMVAAALMTGMRLVLFEAFDPAATPLAIAAHRPTFLGTATPFFVAFLEAQRAHGDRPLFGPCGVASPEAHPSPPNWGVRSAKPSAWPASPTPGG